MQDYLKKIAVGKLQTILATMAILILAFVAVSTFSDTSVESQTSKNVNIETSGDAVEKIKSYPRQMLQFEQQADAPLKIVESKVTEISGEEYAKLTSKTTELKTVISFPETRFLNTSDRNIKQVFFLTKDRATGNVKSIFIRDLSIKPGANFTIKSGVRVRPDYITSVDKGGNVEQNLKEILLSESYWLPTSDKNNLQIQVSVMFEGEDTWVGETGGNS